jgi:hypothetical protein
MNDTYRFRQFYIPERMMGGLTRYVDHGIEPGGFLTAVISNDLKEAVSRADDENLAKLPAYVAWLYNEAPRGCWGSRENMQRWMESFRESSDERT